MRTVRGLVALAILAAVFALGGYGIEIWHDWRGRPDVDAALPPSHSASIPVGVLGDSDSHGYQDEINSAGRFGPYRRVTFQWTEALAQIRRSEVDLGPIGVRGTRRSAALVMDWLGLPGRHPRKQDNLYNLAFGGAGCDSLMGLTGRQAPRLAAEIKRDPERWGRGIVVIRIGINDLSTRKVMESMAKDPHSALAQERVQYCLAQISAAVALIHEADPGTRIVLVGVLNNADDAPSYGDWQAEDEYHNLRRGLDAFDDGLRRMVSADKRLAFFDDAAWFAAHMGTRDARGKPTYRTFYVGPERFAVRPTSGDAPDNFETQDLHLGVVVNALWAQSLVRLIDESFGPLIKPITDAEVLQFLGPAMSAFNK